MRPAGSSGSGFETGRVEGSSGGGVAVALSSRIYRDVFARGVLRAGGSWQALRGDGVVWVRSGGAAGGGKDGRILAGMQHAGDDGGAQKRSLRASAWENSDRARRASCLVFPAAAANAKTGDSMAAARDGEFGARLAGVPRSLGAPGRDEGLSASPRSAGRRGRSRAAVAGGSGQRVGRAPCSFFAVLVHAVGAASAHLRLSTLSALAPTGAARRVILGLVIAPVSQLEAGPERYEVRYGRGTCTSPSRRTPNQGAPTGLHDSTTPCINHE